jgi:oligopeptidase A
MNPLLQDAGAPDFAAIRPEHIAPAMDVLLAAAEAALEQAVSAAVPVDYNALSLVLDVPVERLMRAWGHASHLQGVADTPALRAAHAENLPRIIDFSTRLGADARLYAKYKAIAAGLEIPGAQPLTPAQRKALADALRNFVLGGAELQGAARGRHAAIQDRMGALSQQYGDHVLDATDAWSLLVGEERLAGVPADVRDAARAAAAADGQPGYKLSLQAPCWLPLMQFASDRSLRETLYRADATRASEFGPAERDNGPLMRELLELRAEEAALLGYASYAELALVPRWRAAPTRCWPSCATWRAAPARMPTANWPSCAPTPPTPWACPTCRPGTAPMPPNG